MDKYGLTLKVNGENTVAFRAFTLFSDVEMSWLQSCQIGGHFHMQMTFRQLVANSFGLYLIRKWTWVKRQKSSSRFIIALIMAFCSSFNSNSISKSFKSLEMAPTAFIFESNIDRKSLLRVVWKSFAYENGRRSGKIGVSSFRRLKIE